MKYTNQTWVWQLDYESSRTFFSKSATLTAQSTSTESVILVLSLASPVYSQSTKVTGSLRPVMLGLMMSSNLIRKSMEGIHSADYILRVEITTVMQ